MRVVYVYIQPSYINIGKKLAARVKPVQLLCLVGRENALFSLSTISTFLHLKYHHIIGQTLKKNIEWEKYKSLRDRGVPPSTNPIEITVKCIHHSFVKI